MSRGSRFLGWGLVAVLAACGTSSDDRSKQEVRAAGQAVDKQRDKLASEHEETTRNERELAEQQRALAAKEAVVASDRRELGSAQGNLVTARAAYDAAVKQRFAKLDVALNDLAGRTDTASKDVAAGLRTRRDLLAALLATMPATTDASWDAYTKDLNTRFDGIERDLHAAK